MRRMTGVVAIGLGLLGAACADEPVGPGSRMEGANEPFLQESQGRGVFQRYVAIGTSVSEGWRDEGVVGSSQRTSWPAQLARLAHREMTQPYISEPGCRSPFRAPLALGIRTSGEAAGASSFSCAPLEEGIVLPTQNVAVSSARTNHALYMTPALAPLNHPDPFYWQLYPLVLPRDETQVSAAISQNPKFVSVELGGNDVLDARSGIAIFGQPPNGTITSFAAWKTDYTEILSRLSAVTKQGVLVGLMDDVGTFPSFRRGSELWADRQTFAAFHIAVDANCDANQNLIFVPVRVPVAVATGAALKQAGLPPFAFSCAASPLPYVRDFVLDAAEIAIVNGLLAQMNAEIATQAAALGWAHFELEVLYGRSDIKPPYSVAAQMLTATPYGIYTGLDGIHPSAAGARVIAEAAAAAINARYDLGIETATPAYIAAR
jgi:hypothetical protein